MPAGHRPTRTSAAPRSDPAPRGAWCGSRVLFPPRKAFGRRSRPRPERLRRARGRAGFDPDKGRQDVWPGTEGGRLSEAQAACDVRMRQVAETAFSLDGALFMLERWNLLVGVTQRAAGNGRYRLRARRGCSSVEQDPQSKPCYLQTIRDGSRHTSPVIGAGARARRRISYRRCGWSVTSESPTTDIRRYSSTNV